MVPTISSGCGYVCWKLRAGELLALLDAFNILRAEDAESGVHGGFGVQGLSCPDKWIFPPGCVMAHALRWEACFDLNKELVLLDVMQCVCLCQGSEA